jgi:DNA-binding transcriptional LysR family regulator
MNQLRHMAIFAYIVETGSITAAAESLQISKSVVSQHLKTLEQNLGITLLKRTTRRQTLTPAGQDFYQHCKSLNQIVNQAWQQAKEVLEVPKGKVRITAPNALMETLIAPAIAEVMKEYPLLQPELISSDIRQDLMADNIDLAIRVGQSGDSNIKQRRIGEFRDVLCATDELLAHKNIEEIAYIANSWQAKKIHHEFESTKKEADDNFIFSAEARCISNSFNTCLTLVQSGAGVGLIPEFRLDKKTSALKPVFPDYQLALNPIYALHTFDMQLPLNVSVCINEIEKTLAKIKFNV